MEFLPERILHDDDALVVSEKVCTLIFSISEWVAYCQNHFLFGIELLQIQKNPVYITVQMTN